MNRSTSKNLEISVNTPKVEEMRDVIRSLKYGKENEVDAIHAEMLSFEIISEP